MLLALEGQAKKDEKDHAYVEKVQEAAVQAKTLTKKALAVSEAAKKKVEDSLARLHDMYKKIETDWD